MPQPPQDIRTTPVSTAKGRRWLKRSISDSPQTPQVAIVRNTKTGDLSAAPTTQQRAPRELPSKVEIGTPTKRNEVRVTSVEIPDVSLTIENCPLAAAQLNEQEANQKTLSDPKQIAVHLAEASDQRLGEIAAQLDPTSDQAASRLKIASDDAPGTHIPMTDATENSSEASATATADQEEPSESWSTQADPAKSRPQSPSSPEPQKPPTPQVSDFASLEMGYQEITHDPVVNTIVEDQEHLPDQNDQPLTGVIESILAKKLPKQSTSLMFAGSEGNPLVDSTAADVCSLLAKQRLGRVLLIDANRQSQQLSISSGAHGKAGMAEVVIEQTDWRELVRCGAASGVDFLPIGNQTIGSQPVQARLRELMSDLKTEYDFVCLSVGDSDSNHAKRWSEFCDGCYLLISQKNDNSSIARAAITELQTSGARILGCVVTDSKG